MNISRKQKIGILGGMGPQASLELLRLIVAKASSVYGAKECDAYLEVIVDSIPIHDFISDTQRIGDASITLRDRAGRLQKFGCNPIVMAL